MFTVRFDPRGSIYKQLYEALIDEIRSGRIAAEERLPSRRALARHLGISLNTVKRSYELLLDEGYIVSRERSGYFVDKLNMDHLAPQRSAPRARPRQKEPDPDILYDFSVTGADRSRLPHSVLARCAADAVKLSAREMPPQKESRLYGISLQGLPELRAEVARYLRGRRGVDCDPSEIVITSGYRENLSLIMNLLPDAVFAAEDPGYTMTSRIFENRRRQVLPVPLDRYGLSVAHLERTEADAVIVTPNHQFPTGIIMGIRRSQRLLRWAASSRYIIEDCYDSDFKYSGKPIPALKSLDREDRVILSGSFSQNMAHLFNLGYLILPRGLMDEYLRSGQAVYGASLITQLTLLRFMQSGAFEKHLNRMNAYYRKKHNLILAACKSRQDVEIRGAEAGQHVVLRLPAKYENRRLRLHLEAAWRNKGIRIVPLASLSQRPPEHPDYLLGYGAIPLDQLAEALRLLLEEL